MTSGSGAISCAVEGPVDEAILRVLLKYCGIRPAGIYGKRGVFMPYISRALEPIVLRAAREFPVVMLTGPRQSRKTSLLSHLLGKSHRWVSLELPDYQAAARSAALLSLWAGASSANRKSTQPPAAEEPRFAIVRKESTRSF